MGIQIRKELNNIIQIHEKILNSIKTQKVRLDNTFNKYEGNIEEEIALPANRYMAWTRFVSPFLESVNTCKLVDIQLMQQYQEFVKDIVRYEGEYVLTEQEVVELEHNYDNMTNLILKLERKILDIRTAFQEELNRAKISAINIYQSIPIKQRKKEDVCVYCGIKLESRLGDSDEECAICANIPDDVKPFILEGKDEEISEELEKVPETTEEIEEEKPPDSIDIPFDETEKEEKPEKEEEEDLSESMNDYETEKEEEEIPKSPKKVNKGKNPQEYGDPEKDWALDVAKSADEILKKHKTD